MAGRLRAVFADAPIVFFGVVIGVALLFRVTVGWVREASTPPEVAPTFVTGAEPRAEPATTTPTAIPAPSGTTTLNAEIGAVASVQPIGSPRPMRVAPKPRGHGRRTPIRE